MTAGLLLDIYKCTGRSWNTNTGWVGKDLQAHPGPPLPWAGTPGHPGIVEGGRVWNWKSLKVLFNPNHSLSRDSTPRELLRHQKNWQNIKPPQKGEGDFM